MPGGGANYYSGAPGKDIIYLDISTKYKITSKKKGVVQLLLVRVYVFIRVYVLHVLLSIVYKEKYERI